MQRLAVKPSPITFGANALFHKVLHRILLVLGHLVGGNILQQRNDTRETQKIVRRVAQRRVEQFERLVASVQNHIERFVGNVANGHVEFELEFVGNGFQLPEYHRVAIFAQWNNATVFYAQLLVWDNFVDIYLIYNA